MFRYIRYLLIISLLSAVSCQQVLEPEPVNLLVDDLVLNEANDVEPVRIGLYSALRGTAAPTVIAGDFTADFIQFNGTFTDYQELGTKQITAANGVANELWRTLFRTIYVANFITERLPNVAGVSEARRNQVLAEARFIRGYANFVGANTYGDFPLVTSTEQAPNRTIGRSPKAQVLTSVLADFQAALTDLPDLNANSTNALTNAAYLNKVNCRAMLARYYLYQNNWAQAEQFATQVLTAGRYSLQTNYADAVLRDFSAESVLEVGYALTDDPGTSAFGLNNLLVGRREVIPSNQVVLSLVSAESGSRRATISFDTQNLRGSDNGWTVRKYGTELETNNNIAIMRLAEVYLIRAEARARQGRLTGENGAIADINVLRTRARAPALAAAAQADVLAAIERERVYELAFEGHRWYDLIRTGRVQAVMSAFSPNWNARFERWPVPQTEIQQNPTIRTQQNPGY